MEYSRPAKKSLGQHFLTDLYYLDRIVYLLKPLSKQRLIEIGPGSGCLTDLLVLSCQSLTLIELDKDCVSYLQKQYADFSHIDIYQVDFLQFNLSVLPYRSYRWVGNLPYNVSVPILLRLATYSSIIEDGLFLVQHQVAQRCAAQMGDKHYGRLSIALQCVFSVQMVLSVPPAAFSPSPNVDSQLIYLRPLAQSKFAYLQHSHFSQVLKRSFSQRRKMLRKIFQPDLSLSDWELLNIDPRLRPEQISSDQFYQIAVFLAQRPD